jgi:hypothetical protein
MARTKKISTFNVATPVGDLVLSAKAGEDPEFKAFTTSIEDSDDGLSNDGKMIFNEMTERAYIQGVFLYEDDDIPSLKSVIDFVKTNPTEGVPANIVWTDSSIDSNTGCFVGALVYNGTGTIELKFACAKDWINS